MEARTLAIRNKCWLQTTREWQMPSDLYQRWGGAAQINPNNTTLITSAQPTLTFP